MNEIVYLIVPFIVSAMVLSAVLIGLWAVVIDRRHARRWADTEARRKGSP